MEYSINNDEKYINTENFYVKLTNDFTVIEQNKINVLDNVLEKKYNNQRVRGLEDSRCITFKNEKYTMNTSFEYGDYSTPSMILCKLDNENNIKGIYPQKYNNNICQKNWCPLIYENSLCFIYSYNPFILLKMNEETMILEEYIKKDFVNYNFSKFRGSSNYILLDNGINDKYYLGIIHEIIIENPRKYVHRFVKFDEKLNIIDISIPFYFIDFFVEFVLSLDYNKDEDTLIIPFSIKDCSTHLCKLKIDSIEWLGNNIEDKIISYL